MTNRRRHDTDPRPPQSRRPWRSRVRRRHPRPRGSATIWRWRTAVSFGHRAVARRAPCPGPIRSSTKICTGLGITTAFSVCTRRGHGPARATRAATLSRAAWTWCGYQARATQALRDPGLDDPARRDPAPGQRDPGRGYGRPPRPGMAGSRDLRAIQPAGLRRPERIQAGPRPASSARPSSWPGRDARDPGRQACRGRRSAAGPIAADQTGNGPDCDARLALRRSGSRGRGAGPGGCGGIGAGTAVAPGQMNGRATPAR